MDPYASLLPVQLVATLAAGLAVVARRLARYRRRFALGGWLVGIAAGVFHITRGHRPGRADALGMFAFLGAHRLWAVLLLAATVLLLWPPYQASQSADPGRS